MRGWRRAPLTPFAPPPLVPVTLSSKKQFCISTEDSYSRIPPPPSAELPSNMQSLKRGALPVPLTAAPPPSAPAFRAAFAENRTPVTVGDLDPLTNRPPPSPSESFRET